MIGFSSQQSRAEALLRTLGHPATLLSYNRKRQFVLDAISPAFFFNRELPRLGSGFLGTAMSAKGVPTSSPRVR
jgi:hypothetical protein